MVDLSIEIPDGWLDGEERCGYYVSHEVKEVWAVLLDLYSEFARVCDIYGIKHFVSYGTALGAVRHGGFIPWDDDFDVMMLREDYDRLCVIAEEFDYPYFFQTAKTDVGYKAIHAQLRRSDTTGVLISTLNYRRRHNQGIFLDIFPLDAVPDGNIASKAQGGKIALFDKLAPRSLSHGEDWAGRPHSAKARLAHPALWLLSKVLPCERLVGMEIREQVRYKGMRTERVSNLSIAPGDPRMKRDRTDLASSVMMPFEFLQVPVPAGYDHALRRLYGNYEKYVIGGSAHGEVVFDVNTPYDIWLDAYFDEG